MLIRPILSVLSGVVLLALVLLAGCGEYSDLPANINTRPEDFGANDTSFVRIGPDWDNANGYNWTHPGDIQIGRDGLLYLIDEGGNNGRVLQMRRDGQVLNSNLFESVLDTSQPPGGIGQDSRLNLYMVNNTSNVYLWNQYVALHGIRHVFKDFEVLNTETNDTLIWTWEQVSVEVENPNSPYVLIGSSIEDHPDTLSKYESPYVVYSDTLKNGAQFTDVDGGVDGKGVIFLVDKYNDPDATRQNPHKDDRIISLNVVRKQLIELNNGELYYIYHGEFNQKVLGVGQGEGSTQDPTSITSEPLGTDQALLYFCNSTGVIRVQRVKGNDDYWNYDFNDSPEGRPEVRQDYYFNTPKAIAVGERDQLGLGLFYVADSLQNRVAAFHPNGFLFREVAAASEIIELQPGDTLRNRMNELNLTFHPELNGSIAADSVARIPECFDLVQGDIILRIVEDEGYSWDQILNPPVSPDFTAAGDTTICLDMGIILNLSIQFPILNGPSGVATLGGVVYISDTMNNRILRYKRSNADSYLPDEGN
ncbi:hypothetical protein K8I28_11600 [bacterium]|nr:hypothetical protein [bacterium]